MAQVKKVKKQCKYSAKKWLLEMQFIYNYIVFLYGGKDFIS